MLLTNNKISFILSLLTICNLIMSNLKLLFPTKLPYVTSKGLYIPEDTDIAFKGLLGNDLMYLVLYHCDRNKSNERRRLRLLAMCKKYTVLEWRRKKRLQKLGLI